LFRVPGRTAVVDELKLAFENDDDLLAGEQPRRMHTSTVHADEHSLHHPSLSLAKGSRRKYNPEDVATLLKLYLRSLPNPVFPAKLYMTFAEVDLRVQPEVVIFVIFVIFVIHPSVDCIPTSSPFGL
jgi:hypothetical protein